MYYTAEMKARVSPGEWSKTYSILAPTQDSNQGGRIQNHKRWPLHYHCTVYRFSKTTSHVRVSGRILARLLRPLSRCHSNAKETKLVIGWKLLSLGRPNPKISLFLGKWRHSRRQQVTCFRPYPSRLSRPQSRRYGNTKETKLVIGWILISLGRPNPTTSRLLGKWRHPFFENAFFENIRTDDSRLSTIYSVIIIIVKGVCIGEPR